MTQSACSGESSQTALITLTSSRGMVIMAGVS